MCTNYYKQLNYNENTDMKLKTSPNSAATFIRYCLEELVTSITTKNL